MKQVIRRPISKAAREHLRTRQSKIDAEADLAARAKKAGALWDSKKRSQAGEKAFVEIEWILVRMCNGPRRCMYCEDSEAWDIEHVKPKSKYPAVAFDWDNYLLACSTCNSRFKGSQYHDGFLDPSASGFDLWKRWRFDARTGRYLSVREDDEGAHVTLKILGFDHRRSDLALRRSLYLRDLIGKIREYGKAKAGGRERAAREFARRFCLSFPAIVEWLLVEDPPLEEVPQRMRKGLSDVKKVKKRYPEIVEDAFGGESD